MSHQINGAEPVAGRRLFRSADHSDRECRCQFRRRNLPNDQMSIQLAVTLGVLAASAAHRRRNGDA